MDIFRMHNMSTLKGCLMIMSITKAFPKHAYIMYHRLNRRKEPGMSSKEFNVEIVRAFPGILDLHPTFALMLLALDERLQTPKLKHVDISRYLMFLNSPS